MAKARLGVIEAMTAAPQIHTDREANGVIVANRGVDDTFETMRRRGSLTAAWLGAVACAMVVGCSFLVDGSNLTQSNVTMLEGGVEASGADVAATDSPSALDARPPLDGSAADADVDGASGTVLLGDPQAGSVVDQVAFGSGEAAKFTAKAGEVHRIFVSIDATNTATFEVGLYEDYFGSPKTLLARGKVNTPIAGWNAVTLDSAARVDADGVYWLAIMSTTAGKPVVYNRDALITKSQTNMTANTDNTSLPTSWWSGSNYPDDPAMCIYATD